jgi:hypothetical protein
MPLVTGILSLGTRRDASTWQTGCESVGITAELPIKRPAPSLDQLKRFFKSSPNWIFFGGHFLSYDVSLLNDEALHSSDGEAVLFEKEQVVVKIGDQRTPLQKTTGDFALHKQCSVVLWGGCSVCTNLDTMRTMRALFGAHLLLGFSNTTGPDVIDAALGGGNGPKPNFFERVKEGVEDLSKVRDAWLETAKWWDASMQTRFRAIDPDGQEWQLTGGSIARGRKVA